MAVPEWYENYLARLHPNRKIALQIAKLETQLLKIGMFDKNKIRQEIERLKKLPNFNENKSKMATNPKKEKLAAMKVEQLKPKAKRLGVKLTNPSGNAKTKAQLINAIIKAEEKKPAVKKPAAKKRVATKGLAPVVGASKRRDAKRQALPPGRRVSKTGRVYYERRSNRADAGQMLGEKYQGWKNYWTWRWGLEMIDEDYIHDLKNEVADSYELSKVLRDQAEDFVAESIGGTPFESWMFAVLSEIDWRELAEVYYKK